jgi:hypothetical protein
VSARNDYEDLQDAELARWPGISWTRETRSKHNAIVLTFNGLSRFVTYPCTPGDTIRGGLNHVRDLRHAAYEIGARRLKEERSAQPRRKRNRTEAKGFGLLPCITRLSHDPFAKLADYQCQPKGWARIRAYFVRAA